MGPFWRTAIAIGGASFLSDFVLDRFIIKSDTGDPSGFVMQAEGFGADDITRALTIGAVGAMAARWARKG